MATHILDWRELPPADCRGGAFSIGNFDGVHRGHAALVVALRERAVAVHGPAVAVTFDPHPLDLLRPGQAPPPLTTTAERARLLHALGAAHVLVLRTTAALLALPPVDFFNEVLRQRFQARALVEGNNFAFGHNRAGDIATLAQLCDRSAVMLTVVPPVRVDGGEVSSSRIRASLTRGEVAEAATLLGRPYRVAGVVVAGARRGRTIGFPTANLSEVPTLVPGDGVYAVRAHAAAVSWQGAANIGPNPTFAENARKVEVHLLGFQGDLYGRELAVDFLARIRDTRPFRGPAELIAQLTRDVEQARRLTSAE